MNTLNIIQVLSKIARILSKIVSVCCIVGFAMCITAFIPAIVMGENVFTIGDVSFYGLVENYVSFNKGSLYCALIQVAVFCMGEAVLAEFAFRYFSRELKDGTPFNSDGANELFRLGCLAVGIPLVTEFTSEIVYSIFNSVYGTVESIVKLSASPIAFGIMFIIMSLLCRLGAENKC